MAAPTDGDRLEPEQPMQLESNRLDGIAQAAAEAFDADRGARDHLSRCLGHDEATGSARISLEAEVPEALFDGMRAFLSSRPEWDQYRVITSALAGFLFQNGCSDRCVAQHYLNGLFMKPGE